MFVVVAIVVGVGGSSCWCLPVFLIGWSQLSSWDLTFLSPSPNFLDGDIYLCGRMLLGANVACWGVNYVTCVGGASFNWESLLFIADIFSSATTIHSVYVLDHTLNK